MSTIRTLGWCLVGGLLGLGFGLIVLWLIGKVMGA